MRTLLAVFLAATLPACGGAPASVPAPVTTPREIVAATDEGFAILDADTGAVRRSFSTAARVEHLALDPFRRRLLTFESDDRDEGGSIVAHAYDRLDERESLAFLDGVARVQPAPFGVIVFEESYGTRWRLLGSPHAIPAPLPSAVFLEGDVVRALERDEQTISGHAATIEHGELTIASAPVDREAPFVRAVELGFRVVADARALDGDRIVALVDAPPALVIANRSGIECVHALGDDVRTDLARGLLVLDAESVLVATTHSLRALRVRNGAIESVFVAPGAHAPIDGPL